MIFYDDITSGDLIETGMRALSRKDIIDFASVYDAQPFHLDEEAATNSLLGGLAASGWQTASLTQRLVHEAFIGQAASLGSPGIEELKWLKPAVPDVGLRARIHVGDKRVSKSRPEMGLVNLFVEVMNETGAVVMTQRNVLLMGVRGATQKPIERPVDGGAQTQDGSSFQIDPPQERPRRPWPKTQYLEDLPVGQEILLGKEHFTAQSIIAFATAYDPQPFHLDEAAARQSHFGALAASGWQTGASWMKHYVAYRDAFSKEFSEEGGILPDYGPSPGFVDLKWLRPVYAGDTITYTTLLERARPTSRRGWGLITSLNRGFNQNGQLVFSFRPSIFWQMKPV